MRYQPAHDDDDDDDDDNDATDTRVPILLGMYGHYGL